MNQKLTPEQMEKRKKTNKILLIVIAVIFVLLGRMMCSSNDDSVKKDTVQAEQKLSATPDKVDSSSEKSTNIQSNWHYEDNKDEMTNESYPVASIESTNEQEFDFPYNGGSKLILVVRKQRKNEIILSITKGQFMSAYDNAVKFSFDEGPVKSYRYSEPESGKSDVIFIDNSADLLEKIKKSKKIKVQPAFFQEAGKVFYFNVEGLEWK